MTCDHGRFSGLWKLPRGLTQSRCRRGAFLLPLRLHRGNFKRLPDSVLIVLDLHLSCFLPPCSRFFRNERFLRSAGRTMCQSSQIRQWCGNIVRLPKNLGRFVLCNQRSPCIFPRSTPVAAAVVLDKHCLLLYVTAWPRPIIVISHE